MGEPLKAPGMREISMFRGRARVLFGSAVARIEDVEAGRRPVGTELNSGLQLPLMPEIARG